MLPVSLVNYSSGSGGPEPTIIGMTGNALRDLFIENYNYRGNPNDPGEVTSRSNNVEPQIRLLAQAGCALDGIDAEGSKRPVISTADCVMQITNLYLEHIEIAGLYPKLLYFGGGRYSLHGMNLDGILYAQDDPNTGGPSFSTLINGDAGAEIVISGVRSNPFPPKPAGQDTRDPDVGGGLLPYNGPLFLVGGTSATYHLLDRPQLPNYPEAQRGTVLYEPEGSTGLQLDEEYREALLYAGDQNTAAVRAPTAKAIADLSFGTVAAGQIVSKTVGICVGILPGATPPAAQAIPNARPGDVVSLGPPADLPAGLVATGLVVSPGCVEIRLHNTLGSNVAVPTQTWTVETGGGPNGGEPQIISSGASSGSAYPPNQ